MFTRRIFNDIKSLLHFDYPYHSARNSGLKDECNVCEWTTHGSAMFASRYSPADIIISDAPKFGYRCLYTQSANDYVQSVNDIFNSPLFCAEIHINLKTSSAGNIFSFLDGESEAFSLSVTSGRNFKLNNYETSLYLPLNTWTKIFLRYDGTQFILEFDNQSVTLAEEHPHNFKGIKIGGCHALFDEFIFRNSPAKSSVIDAPAQGWLDIVKMGGVSNGGFAAPGNQMVDGYNTAATVISADNLSFTVDKWRLDTAYAYSVRPGYELFFYVNCKDSLYQDLAGRFAFRRVIGINGTQFTIDYPIVDEFDMNEAIKHYNVYVALVPNFSETPSFGINQIVPAFFGVGIVKFKSNLWLNSDVIYTGDTTFYNRRDNFQLSNGDLPDRILGAYGTVIILCGGTLTWQVERKNKSFNNADRVNYIIAAKKLNIHESQFPNITTKDYQGLRYLAGELI